MSASIEVPTPLAQQPGEVLWSGVFGFVALVAAVVLVARWFAIRLDLMPDRTPLLVGVALALLVVGAVFIAPV